MKPSPRPSDAHAQTIGNHEDFCLAGRIRRVVIQSPACEAWRADLGIDDCQLDRCAALLSRDERQRAMRLRTRFHQRQFIATRGVLRYLLGRRLARHPGSLSFEYNSAGKPRLAGADAGLQFNASHAGRRAVYVISDHRRVGIDVESVDRELDFDGIARRFFSAPEYTALQGMPAAQRKRAFLAAWTCKESIVKAIGNGLRLPLNEIELNIAPERDPSILRLPGVLGGPWELYPVPAGRDYIATVAVTSA